MTTPNETRTVHPNFWLRAIEHRKHQLTRDYRATLGDTAREGVSDEDYATTMATLEKMARNLGWSEEQQDERPGFGRGHRHGFGHHRPGHFGGRPMRDQGLPTEKPEA